MLNYENFQKVFESGKRPYWWLFQGKSKTGGTPIGSNSDTSDMSESWEMLNELIDNYGDGIYTIEVKGSITSARNNPMHTFFVGSPETASVARVGNFMAPPQADPSNAFTKGVDMRYWLDKVDALTEKVRTLEMQKIALENRLYMEQIKRKELEQTPPDNLGRIVGLIENQPQVLSAIMGIFTNGQAPAPAIGVLKATKPIPTPPQAKQQEIAMDSDEQEDEDFYDDDDEQDTDAPVFTGAFSIDRAFSACVRIMNALPEHDVNVLLEKIADTAEHDPAKINMAIKFL